MGKIPEGKQRELAPDGTHNATCVQFLDLGTQPSNNPKFKPSRRCQIGWELVGQRTEEGNAFVVYKEFTYSNNVKSGLMKELAKWFNMKPEQLRELDMDELMQKMGVVTIEHKKSAQGNTYANVTAITSAPGTKGMKNGKHTEPLKSLFLNAKEFDQAMFETLPEWLRAKIAQSPEYADAVSGKMKGKATPAKKGKK